VRALHRLPPGTAGAATRHFLGNKPRKETVPRLACIIPALGTTESLETTLVSVLERRPDHCEVLVVLNTPYADPYNLQGEVQFLQAPDHADLISCLNIGISSTQAPIVHLLASGWLADEGWIERALAHFNDPRVAAVTPAIHAANDHNQLLAAGVGYCRGGRKTICDRMKQSADQSSLNSVGPLLQAAFYRKSALSWIGGLPIGVGEQFADVDLALSLRHAGWHIETDPTCRVFAPAIEAPHANGFFGGLYAERLFWRHASELGRIGSLLSHPSIALSDVANSTPRWTVPMHIVGRFIALFQTGYYRRYRQALAGAQVEAAAAKSAWEAQQVNGSHAAPAPARHQVRVDAPHKTAGPVEARPVHASRRQKSR
jgi:hypothetical protein